MEGHFESALLTAHSLADGTYHSSCFFFFFLFFSQPSTSDIQAGATVAVAAFTSKLGISTSDSAHESPLAKHARRILHCFLPLNPRVPDATTFATVRSGERVWTNIGEFTCYEREKDIGTRFPLVVLFL